MHTGFRFPTGKLPVDTLASLLARLPASDPRLLVGPRIGEDAAVIDMGDRCLVVTTDPITFAIDRIGWYAVHVNANDVAVTGARPRWFFAVLLLPEAATTLELVETILAEIETTCAEVGATLCGGHTEVTPGLDRPIVIGQMIGEVSRERLIRKQRLEAGDRILLARGVAIEGTAILARERGGQLAGSLEPAVLERASRLLFNPGISVVRAARLAAEASDVHAMHDPTEGGVVGALVELAAAAGVGLRIHADRIPILPETLAVCEILGVDPLRLIASGALLIGTTPASAPAVRQALERHGIFVSEIGEAVAWDRGCRIETGGRWLDLVAPERDELARLLDEHP